MSMQTQTRSFYLTALVEGVFTLLLQGGEQQESIVDDYTLLSPVGSRNLQESYHGDFLTKEAEPTRLASGDQPAFFGFQGRARLEAPRPPSLGAYFPPRLLVPFDVPWGAGPVPADRFSSTTCVIVDGPAPPLSSITYRPRRLTHGSSASVHSQSDLARQCV